MDSQRFQLNLADSDSDEDLNPTNHNIDAIKTSGFNSFSSVTLTNTVSNPSPTSAFLPKIQMPQTSSGVPCVANVTNKTNSLFALIGKMLDESESKSNQSSSTTSISLPVITTVEHRPMVQLGLTPGNPGNFGANPSVVKGTVFTMPDPPSAPSYQVPIHRNPSNATLGMRRTPVQQPTASSRIHFIFKYTV